MRRRLCEAALDVLCEVGFQTLMTPMIAARSGVSRGAQTHHFATKTDMLVGAFEHLLQVWDEARHAAFGGRNLGEVPFQGLSPLRLARDLQQAKLRRGTGADAGRARGPELGDRLRRALDLPASQRNLRWRQLLRFPEVRKEEQFQYMTLCLLRGMALHASFNRSDDVNGAVLEAWIELADKVIAVERPECSPAAKSERPRRKARRAPGA